MNAETIERSWITDTNPYAHKCVECGHTFYGDATRVACRDCSAPAPKLKPLLGQVEAAEAILAGTSILSDDRPYRPVPVPPPAEPVAFMAVLRPFPGETEENLVFRVKQAMETEFDCVYAGRLAIYAQMGDAPKPQHTEPSYDAPDSQKP